MFEIGRKAYREHQQQAPTRRRFDLDRQLPAEGQQLQRRARDDIVNGKQSCLDLGWLRGQKCESKTTKADRQALERERLFETNFYALDTETNGFKHNEPIQVAAIVYEDGQEGEQYNQYFKATQGSTSEALGIHGLTKKKLKEKQAKHFNKTNVKALMQFLNRQR